jgi:ubiquitin-protein ligase E3 C
MFPSFTGSSRRPRQVNLSGRNPNPFASVGAGGGSNVALANAQQDREKRQKERERLHAAIMVQRVWRGHNSWQDTMSRWRETWDTQEHMSLDEPQSTPQSAYNTTEEALKQLELLLRFFRPREDGDVRRLLHFCARLQASSHEHTVLGGPWPLAYLRLEKACLQALDHLYFHDSNQQETAADCNALFGMLATLVPLIPKETARQSKVYYRTMSHCMRSAVLQHCMSAFLGALTAPITNINSETLHAYEGFALEFLVLPELHEKFKDQDSIQLLSNQINTKLLARAILDSLKGWEKSSRADQDKNFPWFGSSGRLALLAHFIFFYRATHQFASSESYSSENEFVLVVASLLPTLADEIDVERRTFARLVDATSPPMFDIFTQQQLLSLVNQESVGGMLRQSPSSSTATSAADAAFHAQAQLLAAYALTLLRMFPRRGDEIRMWLYLGSNETGSTTAMPAIKYFWQAVRGTECFTAISKEPKTAIDFLKVSRHHKQPGWQPPEGTESTAMGRRGEWSLIFVFMELYTFVLKVMDDDEFFSPDQAEPGRSSQSIASRTRENALPLMAVQELSTFLKKLGFALYFHASKLADSPEADSLSHDIRHYFGRSSPASDSTPPPGNRETRRIPSVAGVAGISFDYVKGLVTGLLRMIYQRDSRRKFLPSDHWLMTSQFDMGGFTRAVVEEEEKRHSVQDSEDEENDNDDDHDQSHGEDDFPEAHLVGTSRTRNLRHTERLRREQRKASRRRYLQAVAPRLEILQNMPFFIPFATRVQIFREFVTLDQVSNDLLLA